MWEICVCLEAKHFKAANFLFNYLKKQVNEFGVYVKKFEENHQIKILLACEEYDKNRAVVFLSNAIIETICIYFKEEFLTRTLNLPIKEGLYYEALKKALISFDKETDAFLISKQLIIEDNKDISLESFYYFKLKSIREKWEELASIANDNGCFLICNDNFIDLLKFLIDNLEISHDTLNVYLEGEKFEIFDELDKSIEICDEENLVTSLIGLCPRQIVFYGERCDNEKLSLLMKIFDNRVKFKNVEKL